MAKTKKKTKIEWTNRTLNPTRGCRKISEGCKACYAEVFAKRFEGTPGPYEEGFKPRMVPHKLVEPFQWTAAEVVFVNSMSDLFLEDFPDDYVRLVLDVLAATPWHTYQVLTKRHDRMRELLSGPFRFAAELPNVWWGVSVENKKHGLPRVDALRETPAMHRFLSVEPLLEDLGDFDLSGVHWVIVGGESAKSKPRVLHPDWVRRVRDICAAANVPFFFKQWGGTNKKATGRVLDGRTYDDMPALASAAVPPRNERMAIAARVLPPGLLTQTAATGRTPLSLAGETAEGTCCAE